MADTQTIPLLPCQDADVTVAFYALLGFEVAHRQSRPNVYLALRRGDAHLHFFGLKPLNPTRASSTCLVIVRDVEELFSAFAASLRTAYGKLPVAGIPRISRYRKGARRFTVVDPAGSSVIFVERGAEANDATQPSRASAPYERARVLAARAELATVAGDAKRAQTLLAEIMRLPLTATDHAQLNAELADLVHASPQATTRGAMGRKTMRQT